MNFESNTIKNPENNSLEKPKEDMLGGENLSLDALEANLRSKGIEVFDMDEQTIDEMKYLLEGKFSKDKEDMMDKLEIADFSEMEIKELFDAFEKGDSSKLLLEKIKEEKNKIAKRLNDPEFIAGLDNSVSALKTFADSVGLTEVLEKRWPKIMYAGKIGRMLIRSKKMQLFDTHAMAMGEYDYEDQTAYIYNAGLDEFNPKVVLQAQLHETIHGVSKNEIKKEDGSESSVSGFAETTFDSGNPLDSKNEMLGLNESVTEYFTRKFSKDAFPVQEKKEHEYDNYVKNFSSILDRVSVYTKKDKTEIEKEVFQSYINGDREAVFELTKSALGKFSPQILGKFFKSVEPFLHAYALQKLGGSPKEKISLEYEGLEKTGVDIQEFKNEYPFARLIKYDFDPVTFEPIEKEA